MLTTLPLRKRQLRRSTPFYAILVIDAPAISSKCAHPGIELRESPSTFDTIIFDLILLMCAGLAGAVFYLYRSGRGTQSEENEAYESASVDAYR